MEKNKNMEVISSDLMEIDNENKDNLNSSLTLLNLNEQKIDNQNIETDKAECSTIPTKVSTLPIRNLPVRNVPEKIIFCLDTGIVNENSAFHIEEAKSYSVLYMFKRVVELFVLNKNFIDPRHEYALITINSKDIKFVRDFSSNPNNIINDLKSEDISDCEDFDISSILNRVSLDVNIPKPMNPLHLPPPYIVRLILLYSRSTCSFAGRKKYEELLNNPYFTVDVIYTHEICPEAKQVFDCLQKVDEKLYSYKFELSRNVDMLHLCMAKLLAHPLQRQIQEAQIN